VIFGVLILFYCNDLILLLVIFVELLGLMDALFLLFMRLFYYLCLTVGP
jgi:hypothetical protein